MKTKLKITGVLVIVASFFLVQSCKKEKNTPPVLTTAEVTGITHTTAISGGDISDDGGATVTARGICWSSSANPTTADSNNGDDGGSGPFTSTISRLSPNTTYYVRAYAINTFGTGYGNQVTFNTSAAATPSLTTTAVSSITQTGAVSGGVISSENGASVTKRGVCWSISKGPTTDGNKTTDGKGTGSFTSTLTGLMPATTYFVRAYAVNSAGTSYGPEISFVTAVASQAYSNGNEAYWNESINGFRPVNIGNGSLIFQYDAVNKQYVSGNKILIPDLNGNPDGEVADKTNFYGFSGGSMDELKFQWDGQKNSAVPATVFDMTNLFVSPVSATTMTYAQALNVNSTMACTGSSNSTVIIDGATETLLYPDKTPASGTFNLWNGEELVYGGNLKNSTSSFVSTKDEYFSQQQLAMTVNKSYCVATYGQGWRLPTDLEIGHNVNTYDPSLQTAIDPGYQGNSGQIFTSSRFLYPSYAFYKWYTVISNGIWNNIDQWSKTKYQVRCVYSGR